MPLDGLPEVWAEADELMLSLEAPADFAVIVLSTLPCVGKGGWFDGENMIVGSPLLPAALPGAKPIVFKPYTLGSLRVNLMNSVSNSVRHCGALTNPLGRELFLVSWLVEIGVFPLLIVVGVGLKRLIAVAEVRPIPLWARDRPVLKAEGIVRDVSPSDLQPTDLEPEVVKSVEKQITTTLEGALKVASLTGVAEGLMMMVAGVLCIVVSTAKVGVALLS